MENLITHLFQSLGLLQIHLVQTVEFRRIDTLARTITHKANGIPTVTLRENFPYSKLYISSFYTLSLPFMSSFVSD